MSADTVDDLHAAEDMAGSMATALRLLVSGLNTAVSDGLEDEIATAVRLVNEWDDYCRPTCGANRVDDEACGDDTCGCPCGHTGRESRT